jgi:hypothetical protein
MDCDVMGGALRMTERCITVWRTVPVFRALDSTTLTRDRDCGLFEQLSQRSYFIGLPAQECFLAKSCLNSLSTG